MQRLMIHAFRALGWLLLLGAPAAQAQELVLPIDSLFALAERNSKQLDASAYQVAMSENATAVERHKAHLPELQANVQSGYISNARVWDHALNYESTVHMPHTSLNFSVAAAYTVFEGHAAKNQIARAELKEQLARLDYRQHKQDIQFLLLGRYLDLYALNNQERVYLQNIELAESRLQNINQLIGQGMLTHNDQIRSRLQLTEIRMQLEEVQNDRAIANHELVTVLGLPPETILVPDSSLSAQNFHPMALDHYQEAALSQLPSLQKAELQTQVAGREVALARGKRLPDISLFAQDAMARPFLYTVSPLDIYMHYVELGVRLHYNIGSLYNSKRKIQQAEMQRSLSVKQSDWLKEQAGIDTYAAWVKMQESWDKLHARRESCQLARDNYHVIEQQYLNQFVTITDMLDASTSLLAAQLNQNNAEVNIVYQYFALLKSSGLWEQAAIKPN